MGCAQRSPWKRTWVLLGLLSACGANSAPSTFADPVHVPQLPSEPGRPSEPERLAAIHEEHRGVLEEGDDVQPADGSWQDPYRFEAQRGDWIEIEMHSDALDAYLILADPNDQKIGENDDAEEGSTNARIRARAPSTGTYTVLANSYSAGETGPYTLSIRTTPPR